MNALLILIDSLISTSKRQEGMDVGGRTATNIPKTPSPASNHRKNFIFMDHHQKGPPNYTVPKFAETAPTVALTRALLSQGGGGGGGRDVLEGGGGAEGFEGGHWDPPPLRVPLWFPPKAGQKCLRLNQHRSKILLPSARHLKEGRGTTFFELLRRENCISRLCPRPLGSPPPPTPK